MLHDTEIPQQTKAYLINSTTQPSCVELKFDENCIANDETAYQVMEKFSK